LPGVGVAVWTLDCHMATCAGEPDRSEVAVVLSHAHVSTGVAHVSDPLIPQVYWPASQLLVVLPRG
jgi:hypothetical protein